MTFYLEGTTTTKLLKSIGNKTPERWSKALTGSCATLRDRNWDSGQRRVGASVRLMLRKPGRMPGRTDACERNWVLNIRIQLYDEVIDLLMIHKKPYR